MGYFLSQLGVGQGEVSHQHIKSSVVVDLLIIVHEDYVADLEGSFKLNKHGTETHPCSTPYSILIDLRDESY